MPSWRPTEEQRKEVKLLAAVGTRHEVIRARLISERTKKPISNKTFYKHFKYELEWGREEANALMGKALFEQALSNTPEGARLKQFWMRTRAGWKEIVVNEHVGKDGAPMAVATTAMTLEEMRKAVEQFDREV